MASIGKHFAINPSDGISKNQATFRGSMYRITILTERLIRLEYNPNGNFNDSATLLVKNRDFPMPQFNFEENEKSIVITTDYFTLQYYKEKPFKGSKLTPDSNLKIKLNNTDKSWYYGHPEARNFKGSCISLDNYPDIKLENGLYSTDGFATLDDSYGILIDENGYLHEKKDSYYDVYLFMYRKDFGYCLNDYFRLTGFPALLPRYALGIWWNRDRIYSYENTKMLVNAFNRYEIPLSVLLLSEFWHIKDATNYNKYKTGFTFNPELFPNPAGFLKYMHDCGVRVGLNLDPVEGVRKEEAGYNTMAKELGVTDGNTIPFNAFDMNFISSYIERLINPLLDMGVDFFWIDYKKDLNQLRAMDYYHMKNYDRTNLKRGLLLTRNPLIAAHKYPVLYSGETYVSWKELEYLPKFNATASNIGISWWSHDVGGYKKGIEDSELYLRHVQLATFSPIFRFSAIRGAYYKREPWMWDIKTYTIVKDYCNLRHRLIPYIYSENFAYYRNGLPLIQPLYYNNPVIYDEPKYKNEYHFGSQFLIAPITDPKDLIMNRAVERIYLPEGKWYDFKTGKRFNGDKRYVVFYKDEDYPIYVKAGAIVPMAVLRKNRNDVSIPNEMEIHVFPGKSNIYKLYEDDGISNLYKEGYYTITAIDYNYLNNNYTLIIHPIEGKTGILPKLRDYKIRFRNTKESAHVEAFINNDSAQNRIEKYVDDNDFVVEVFDVDTTKQLTINCKGKDIEIDAVRIINEDINSIISDLNIQTVLKEKIASIIFSNLDISKKRIAIKKLNKEGLDSTFIKMFMKLLEYVAEI